MLGIRKYLGASIDLWQGDIAQFVCDVTVREALQEMPAAREAEMVPVAAGDPGSLPARWLINTPARDLTSAYSQCLQLAESARARHIALPLLIRHLGVGVGTRLSESAIEKAAALAMECTRNFLDGRPAGSGAVKRITFVLPDASSYSAFQQALYRAYPEDLLGTHS